MPASHHWEPPASTLAHRLAVIHPKNSGRVGPKGPMPCPAWYCRNVGMVPLRPRIAGIPARAPHLPKIEVSNSSYLHFHLNHTSHRFHDGEGVNFGRPN